MRIGPTIVPPKQGRLHHFPAKTTATAESKDTHWPPRRHSLANLTILLTLHPSSEVRTISGSYKMDISQQEFQERKREFYDFLELSVRIHLFYSHLFLLIMQSFFFHIQ